MSSANSKGAPEINLDEFERRLRVAGASHGAVEDPLAELTRLVNSIAAAAPREQKVVDLSAMRLPKADYPSQAPAAPPPPQAPPPSAVGPSVEEELRRAIDEATFERAEPSPEAVRAEAPFGDEGVVEAPARSRSWYFKVGGLTAASLVLVVGAAAMKFNSAHFVGRSAPPLIHAAEGPVKVAPPSESAVQSPGDTGALLTKDSTSQTPVTVVSHEEQPVDLSARTTPSPSPSAPASAAPSPSTSPTQTVAAVSPVAPNTEAPLVAPADNVMVAPSPAPPTMRGVRTVTVRPDGSVISVATADGGTPLASAAPAPAPAPPPAPALAPAPAPASAAPSPAIAPSPTVATAIEPSTPSVDLPAKSATKSSARVTAAKTDTTVSADALSPAAPVAPTPKPVKPPTKLRPPAPAPVVVADAADPAVATAEAPVATTPAAEPAPGGNWAVQVGVARSEAEAQSALGRLASKYGSELGGTALALRKAEVNGSTMYRVRAGGLSKAEAAALCSKIKANGGDCFVARN